jgi:hypothetical protein
MDKTNVTDAKSAENPRKIGKFMISLFIALAILLGIVLVFFLHHAPIVQQWPAFPQGNLLLITSWSLAENQRQWHTDPAVVATSTRSTH